ncbi:ribosomal RNA-processing protein 7-domain-containing protein [Cyathus striatus]|nr:ribosomal RNA-processing protein 7-domain-containing protein [Cyathus striatus]
MFAYIISYYLEHSIHYLYARSHTGSKKGSDNALPSGRTLFLVNVPPDATEREFIRFFKHCGTIENDEEDEDEEMDKDQDDADGEQPTKRRRISKEEKAGIPKVVPLPSKNIRTLRKTGRSAHVIFLDASSLDRALAQPHKARPWPTSPEEPRGLLHYISLYQSLRPPLDIVREHADTSIEVYEYNQAKDKQKSKYRKGEAIVDEDGFTLVTRGGAYGQTLGGGVAVASKKFQETGLTRTRNNKKTKKEKEGFYAFQKAERQRKELLDLKKRWEEDKAKVEKLKESRRFRPY